MPKSESPTVPSPNSGAPAPGNSTSTENARPISGATVNRGTAPVEERRQLNVLAQGLTNADIAQVATFLRLGKDRLQCDWTIVFAGEAHALLHGTDEPSTVRGMLDSPLEIRRVSDAGEADRPTAALARPLQYEAVIDALVEAELKCLAGKP